MFETTNRKLEQFLHLHRIAFSYQYKNEDFLTVWVYDKTPGLLAVVGEFRELWGDMQVVKAVVTQHSEEIYTLKRVK